MGFVPIDYNAIGKNHSRNHNHPRYHKHNRNFIQTLLSNDLTIGCPIIYNDIYSHNTIVLKDTSNNAWYNQVHWLIGTPYLSIIAGSGLRAEIKTGLLTDIVSRDILFCSPETHVVSQRKVYQKWFPKFRLRKKSPDLKSGCAESPETHFYV